MKLVYSNNSGSIANVTGQWFITSAPALSFSFDGLFFDDDREHFLKYVGEGRLPLTDVEIVEITQFLISAVKPAPPAPTQAELIAIASHDLLLAVQDKLDAEAKAVGYDSIVSACSYAGAPNPFQAEGQSFVAWRGIVWAYCYGELVKVEAGTRTIPTVTQLLSELPTRT